MSLGIHEAAHAVALYHYGARLSLVSRFTPPKELSLAMARLRVIRMTMQVYLLRKKL